MYRGKMEVPVLRDITPKTITSIGKFNGILNLSRIFDLVPLLETEDFYLLRIKYEGLTRDSEKGGLPIESGSEFKNSITMEILDREYEKIRAVKVNCEGIHMCGNRSIERSRRIADFVASVISDTQDFLERSMNWDQMLKDPHFPKMERMIYSILPESHTPESIKLLLNHFREIQLSGGLYQVKGKGVKESLKIDHLRTVMVNYGYGPFPQIHDRDTVKDEFLLHVVERVLSGNLDAKSEFDIRLDYDSHISSIGWSGSVPLKFVHKKSGQVQWITLQLRRGTIVHSGPNVEVMQRAVDVLFQLLF